jgi:antitoxin component YwqK of YwqJK toxin-antitoxin module
MFPNGIDTQFTADYVDGLLHGQQCQWYPNRKLMEERHFVSGNKEGQQTMYWPNGKKRIEFTAVANECDGLFREWTVDGKLFHEGHFAAGHEEGSQKMWYINGKIRANYVVKKGKRYGLLGTKNCKNVSDSIFMGR